MKKIIAILISISLIMLCLVACTSSGEGDDGTTSSQVQETQKLNVVATVFPIYDWVVQLAGEDSVQMTLLLDSATDLHSYQPTVDDIVTISNCDMFIYVGGESDDWVFDALAQAENKEMIVINLMEILGDKALEEEHIEGMEEHDHEHEEDEQASDVGEQEETEYDEHVWLSLKNARLFCSYISEKLCEAMPENKAELDANLQSYENELVALDEQYAELVENAENKTLVFADRFPFRYLTEDYGLEYYAAFSGCSAETEASFETVSFLADKVDELNLGSVMTIEGANHNIAQTVIDNTNDKNQQILVLDSMQSKTSEDVKNGVTYLSVMQSNLTVLEQALA